MPEILRRQVGRTREDQSRPCRRHARALGKELHEWRPPQVADYVKIKGSGRYAPGQTEEGALADLRAELDALGARHPGLRRR